MFSFVRSAQFLRISRKCATNHTSAIIATPSRSRLYSKSAVTASKPYKHHPGDTSVYSFFEPATESWQYLLVNTSTSEAAIIDPVLDYNPASGAISTHTADGILAFVKENGFKIRHILETHAHADHLTASQYYKKQLPDEVPVCIGKRISLVQKHFSPIYGFKEKDMEKHFDVLFEDDQEFKLGDVSCRVMHLPGHTPDHVGYVIGRRVFTGDSIFMPDLGSARADFPGGNAKDLFASMTRLLSLPEDYELFVGHDYPPQKREYNYVATVGLHRQNNKHGYEGITEKEFIELREARDRVLGSPRLLHPSLQVNLRAGKMPTPDSEGRIMMKIPVRVPSSMM